MDLSLLTPVLAIVGALALIVVFVWGPRRQQRAVPRCPDCKVPMQREARALDTAHYLDSYQPMVPRPGEDQYASAYRCPRCDRRVLTAY
jgi:hypothetical protein